MLRDYGRATFQVEGGAVEIRGSLIGGRFDILTDRSGMPLVIANNIMTSDDDVAEVQPCNLSDEPAIVVHDREEMMVKGHVESGEVCCSAHLVINTVRPMETTLPQCIKCAVCKRWVRPEDMNDDCDGNMTFADLMHGRTKRGIRF